TVAHDGSYIGAKRTRTGRRAQRSATEQRIALRLRHVGSVRAGAPLRHRHGLPDVGDVLTAAVPGRLAASATRDGVAHDGSPLSSSNFYAVAAFRAAIVARTDS